jgi:hypothetical protein
MTTTEEIQTKVNTFLDKIKTSKEQLFSVLDDFTKYYVLHKKTPDVDEYKNVFDQSVAQIQGVQSDLFNINNAVEKSSEMMNKMKMSIDISILENKKKIEELETKLDSYTGLQGAHTLKNDMVDMYNLQYLGNFCMFVGVLLICALFVVLFKSPGKIGAPSASSISASSSISSTSSSYKG